MDEEDGTKHGLVLKEAKLPPLREWQTAISAANRKNVPEYDKGR